MRPRPELAVALALALAPACVESPAVVCADGLICAPDSVCLEGERRCVARVRFDVCQGQDDGERCAFPGVPEGACDGGLCIPAGCGNGVFEPGEACDDGNREHGDGCAADCLSDESCGNGVVDGPVGEACDTSGETASCDIDCTSAVCGDGVVNAAAGEQCDDGGLNSESCNFDCTLPGCGDGVINPEVGEECDAGGESVECDLNCTIARCGDGDVNASRLETCDDGNLLNGDDCLDDCQPNVCGDGFVDSQGPVTEACDDNNTRGCGTCSATCSFLKVPRAATGTIRAAPLTKAEHEHQVFTLDDGVNSPVTFEIVFDKGVGADPNNRPVALGFVLDADAPMVAASIEGAINLARGKGLLQITASLASAGSSLVDLTNDALTARGNTASSSTVSAELFSVSDMTGGRARDCAAGIGCASELDCASGSCTDGVCD